MKCACGHPLLVAGHYCRECGSWLCACGEVHPDDVQVCPHMDELVLRAIAEGSEL